MARSAGGVIPPKNDVIARSEATWRSPQDPTPAKKTDFFRTMTPAEYKTFTTAIKEAPQPQKAAAMATVAKLEQPAPSPLKEQILRPIITNAPTAVVTDAHIGPTAAAPCHREEHSDAALPQTEAPEPEQTALPLPEAPQWRMVGELYNTYIIVEEGDNAFLIDKHAAHERILFDKLKSHQETITPQALLSPIPVRLSPDAAAQLLSNKTLLDELGFDIDEFGENTVLLRQIPMDLSPDDAADAVETLAADLQNGRHDTKDNVRDEVLHTVACKAAIKAGWHTDEKELLALTKQVMSREDLKYCPHGRPICVTLSKKQLEKQFKRT